MQPKTKTKTKQEYMPYLKIPRIIITQKKLNPYAQPHKIKINK